METLKVSAASNPKAVAGAIASVVRRYEDVEIVMIGAGAVNQAVKAVCIARGFVSGNGLDLAVVPSFNEITVDGAVKTSIKFLVQYRIVEE